MSDVHNKRGKALELQNGPDAIQGISQQNIKTYQQDGVIHLKQVFGDEWIELLREGIEKDLANPGPRFEQRCGQGSSARYCENYWAWSDVPELENFVRSSSAGAIAARMLEASRINLVMDNWFMREAGATAKAPWHHDVAYFDFEGTMCVLWIPLEPVGPGQSIEFVKGSHLWNKLFMRVWFDDHQVAQEPGWVNGQRYEAPPDIEGRRDDFDIVSFDMNIGDCLVFDIRMLHGAPSGMIPLQTSRRFTLRLAAPDARICYRGDWARSERAVFEAAGHRDGDEINSDFFPILWEEDK